MLRRPLPLLPLFVSLGLALSTAALVGCDDDVKVKKPPVTAADPGEQARVEASRKKVDDANRAIGSKAYDKARKLLKEAGEMGVESQRFEIEETIEKLDKKEAKAWANEVEDKLKERDCAGAFQALAKPIHDFASDGFTRELRHLVAATSLKCVQDSIDTLVLAGRYKDARALVGAEDTQNVLGPAAGKKLLAEIESTITDALKGQIADDVKARRYQQAVDKIDAAAKKGDANDDQVAAMLASVREGATPELSTLSSRAVGQRDAGAVLKQIDALVKLLRWEVMDADAAALAKDKALPADVAAKRLGLAIWVEAQRVSMKPLKSTEVRWTYGKVMVFPPAKSDGESKRDLAPATQVWILGLTKDRGLIADSDPGNGPLASMLDKVAGWVPLDRLAAENTLDWLPPDDQLKTQRVWGPLRPPEAIYELGLVVDVQGKEVSVKRLADDVVLKLSRRQLRNGRLAKGTKVVTFCTAKDQPAQIAEVMTNGQGVKLKCDGGQEKEEMMLSLRSKAELLPGGKP